MGLEPHPISPELLFCTQRPHPPRLHGSQCGLPACSPQRGWWSQHACPRTPSTSWRQQTPCMRSDPPWRRTVFSLENSQSLQFSPYTPHGPSSRSACSGSVAFFKTCSALLLLLADMQACGALCGKRLGGNAEAPASRGVSGVGQVPPSACCCPPSPEPPAEGRRTIRR